MEEENNSHRDSLDAAEGKIVSIQLVYGLNLADPKSRVYMYLPQPGIYFGCDCWSQRLPLLWAPARLQSHRLRKTR